MLHSFQWYNFDLFVIDFNFSYDHMMIYFSIIYIPSYLIH